MAITTTTHLNFRGQGKQALDFYQSVFGGQIAAITFADAHNLQSEGGLAAAGEADQIMWGQVQADNGFHVMVYDVPSVLSYDRGDKRPTSPYVATPTPPTRSPATGRASPTAPPSRPTSAPPRGARRCTGCSPTSSASPGSWTSPTDDLPRWPWDPPSCGVLLVRRRLGQGTAVLGGRDPVASRVAAVHRGVAPRWEVLRVGPALPGDRLSAPRAPHVPRGHRPARSSRRPCPEPARVTPHGPRRLAAPCASGRSPATVVVLHRPGQGRGEGARPDSAPAGGPSAPPRVTISPDRRPRQRDAGGDHSRRVLRTPPWPPSTRTAPVVPLAPPGTSGDTAAPGPTTGSSTGSATARTAALLRIAFGLTFLWAFADKLLALGFSTGRDETGAVDLFGDAAWINGGSPTEGFLSFGADGPFQGSYQAIAGAAWADVLFMAGLLGIGVALTLGVVMRLAGAAGALLYVLMWTVVLPPENHPVLDEHLLGALTLVLLVLLDAGRTWGLGSRVARTDLVSRYPGLR